MHKVGLATVANCKIARPQIGFSAILGVETFSHNLEVQQIDFLICFSHLHQAMFHVGSITDHMSKLNLAEIPEFEAPLIAILSTHTAIYSLAI